MSTERSASPNSEGLAGVLLGLMGGLVGSGRSGRNEDHNEEDEAVRFGEPAPNDEETSAAASAATGAHSHSSKRQRVSEGYDESTNAPEGPASGSPFAGVASSFGNPNPTEPSGPEPAADRPNANDTWLSFTGRRSPRIGKDYQIDFLPEPVPWRSAVTPDDSQDNEQDS
jgi:hypothetical protein